jgi:hypothetical protein
MHTSDPKGRGPGHETRDVRIKAVAWLGVSIFVVTALTASLMVWLFGAFESREARRQRPPVSLMRPEGPQLPPLPRLQGQPTKDLAEMRREEDAQLASYGWIDPSAGVVRLPIERAMELVLQRGLPARAEITPPSAPAERSTR